MPDPNYTDSVDDTTSPFSELTLAPKDSLMSAPVAAPGGETEASAPSASAAPAASFKGVLLPINVRERAALYASYMSFVKGGGFFVPTTKRFTMNEEVLLLININIPSHGVDEKLPVRGKVVWITPEIQRPGKVRGIGVQFDEGPEGVQAQLVIEKILGRHIASTRETHTL